MTTAAIALATFLLGMITGRLLTQEEYVIEFEPWEDDGDE